MQYPDWLGPFAMQTRTENLLPKSAVCPRNGVSDLKALLGDAPISIARRS